LRIRRVRTPCVYIRMSEFIHHRALNAHTKARRRRPPPRRARARRHTSTPVDMFTLATRPTTTRATRVPTASRRRSTAVALTMRASTTPNALALGDTPRRVALQRRRMTTTTAAAPRGVVAATEVRARERCDRQKFARAIGEAREARRRARRAGGGETTREQTLDGVSRRRARWRDGAVTRAGGATRTRARGGEETSASRGRCGGRRAREEGVGGAREREGDRVGARRRGRRGRGREGRARDGRAWDMEY